MIIIDKFAAKSKFCNTFNDIINDNNFTYLSLLIGSNELRI